MSKDERKIVSDTKAGIAVQSSRPSVVAMCTSRKSGTTEATGTLPYSATTRCSYLCLADFTDTIAGNRHWTTGDTEGPLLYMYLLSTISEYAMEHLSALAIYKSNSCVMTLCAGIFSRVGSGQSEPTRPVRLENSRPGPTRPVIFRASPDPIRLNP